MNDPTRTTRIAVIGAGSRSRHIVSKLLTTADSTVTISAAYDPDDENTALSLEKWSLPKSTICSEPAHAIDRDDVDWIMVFTPNVYHKDYILAGFHAGKNVFCEKPLATTIHDCVAICDAHRRTGLTLMTGFVLRYSAMYRTIKELLDSGSFGTILNISASENRASRYGGNSMQNWRRFTQLSGPYMLEKCCHDLDLINWFTGSVARRVAGFGALDFFIPQNDPLRDKYGADTFVSKHHTLPGRRTSPFTSEKDIKDNHVAVLEYRNGVKVTFQLTLANAIPERRMYIACTEGTIVAELSTGKLKYRRLGDDEPTCMNFSGDEHGGGDRVMVAECLEHMQTGGRPKTSSAEGLECAVTALAVDDAMNAGTVVDLEPIWKRLGR